MLLPNANNTPWLGTPPPYPFWRRLSLSPILLALQHLPSTSQVDQSPDLSTYGHPLSGKRCTATLMVRLQFSNRALYGSFLLANSFSTVWSPLVERYTKIPVGNFLQFPLHGTILQRCYCPLHRLSERLHKVRWHIASDHSWIVEAYHLPNTGSKPQCALKLRQVGQLGHTLSQAQQGNRYSSACDSDTLCCSTLPFPKGTLGERQSSYPSAMQLFALELASQGIMNGGTVLRAGLAAGS